MANSSYYKNLYKEYENKAKKYNKNIDKLENILRSVSNDLSDEINAVNKEIAELKDDLQRAIRHNDSFNRSQNSLQTEPHVNWDRNLANVIMELEEEIRSLQGKQSNADAKYNYYRQKYKDKKNEEYAQFWGK